MVGVKRKPTIFKALVGFASLSKHYNSEVNMKKTFNIAGPCRPSKHYMLPAQERCQGLFELIEQEQYFILHALANLVKRSNSRPMFNYLIFNDIIKKAFVHFVT